ncbi:hypothetical protein FNV43_RR10852 [Rhamnella rubrinervis]|uniref:Uncharacterized protein n=1 Tax=Rhamnella rubrinervis TaxID=2594499 RepID=A0A8K0H4P9_9ROSA|nr:hypothetical protein FNV43_RR10852 [Rhamnella rubrinervis]
MARVTGVPAEPPSPRQRETLSLWYTDGSRYSRVGRTNKSVAYREQLPTTASRKSLDSLEELRSKPYEWRRTNNASQSITTPRFILDGSWLETTSRKSFNTQELNAGSWVLLGKAPRVVGIPRPGLHSTILGVRLERWPLGHLEFNLVRFSLVKRGQPSRKVSLRIAVGRFNLSWPPPSPHQESSCVGLFSEPWRIFPGGRSLGSNSVEEISLVSPSSPSSSLGSGRHPQLPCGTQSFSSSPCKPRPPFISSATTRKSTGDSSFPSQLVLVAGPFFLAASPYIGIYPLSLGDIRLQSFVCRYGVCIRRGFLLEGVVDLHHCFVKVPASLSQLCSNKAKCVMVKTYNIYTYNKNLDAFGSACTLSAPCSASWQTSSRGMLFRMFLSRRVIKQSTIGAARLESERIEELSSNPRFALGGRGSLSSAAIGGLARRCFFCGGDLSTVAAVTESLGWAIIVPPGVGSVSPLGPDLPIFRAAFFSFLLLSSLRSLVGGVTFIFPISIVGRKPTRGPAFCAFFWDGQYPIERNDLAVSRRLRFFSAARRMSIDSFCLVLVDSLALWFKAAQIEKKVKEDRHIYVLSELLGQNYQSQEVTPPVRHQLARGKVKIFKHHANDAVKGVGLCSFGWHDSRLVLHGGFVLAICSGSTILTVEPVDESDGVGLEERPEYSKKGSKAESPDDILSAK